MPLLKGPDWIGKSALLYQEFALELCVVLLPSRHMEKLL